MKRRVMVLLLIGMCVWSAPTFAQQTGDTALPTTKPLIIDTDMAADDWMAIAYLVQRSDVEVLAVTVTGAGEATCDPGIQNALNLLAHLGKPTIPVACGRDTPLLGTQTFPQDWRDSVNALNGLTLPHSDVPPSSLTAVELLRVTLEESPTPVTLLVLGPMTNIAELVTESPSIIDKIEMVYVMGGAVDARGNVDFIVQGNLYAEWNIYVDPEAAAQVVTAGVPLTFVPLDATNDALVGMPFVDRLRDDNSTNASGFVLDVLGTVQDSIRSGWYYFWDPLAAVVTTDESIVTIEERTIRFVTEFGDEFGRMLTDPNGVRVRVAMSADRLAFENIFLNVLNGRDPQATTP